MSSAPRSRSEEQRLRPVPVAHGAGAPLGPPEDDHRAVLLCRRPQADATAHQAVEGAEVEGDLTSAREVWGEKRDENCSQIMH